MPHFPLLVLRSWSISLEVMLRRNLGSRYLDLQAALAVPLMIVFANLWPKDNVLPVYLFLGTYILACASHRMKRMSRMWRGQAETGHSYYTGTPALMRNFPRYSEITVKRVIEPLFVFIAGAVICQVNRPLGAYLMIGAFSLFVTSGLNDVVERVRAQDMNDAVIEQQGIAERFREMRGDR